MKSALARYSGEYLRSHFPSGENLNRAIGKAFGLIAITEEPLVTELNTASLDRAWLNKLNQFGGNYIDAEMVRAFITLSES